MYGEISHELEVNVGASEAWDLYSTTRLAKFVIEKLPGLLHKVELLEGDGNSVGTVYRITYPPGTPGNISPYKERFTKIDDEKRVKEAEVFEGGFLEIGFNLYRLRFQVIDKQLDTSCIIKSSIQYDIDNDAAANASFVDIHPLRIMAEAARDYLLLSTTTTTN